MKPSPFVRRRASLRTARILTTSAAALLALSGAGSRLFATDGSWTQAAGGTQTWAAGTNWSGGTIADGVDGNAVFSVDLTADQNISLGAAGRTIGNLFFQDPTTGTAGGFGLGVAGDGAVTLDVTSGRSLVDVGNLGSGKKIAVGTPIINADGILKTGAGQFSIRTDSPGMTSDYLAAGGLTDTRVFLSNLTAVQVLNGATFQVDFNSNTGVTNGTNFVNAAASLTLGGVMLIPPTAIPPALPLAAPNTLAFGTAALTITGRGSSNTNSQSFASTTLKEGVSTVTVTNGGAGASATLNLGAITRNVGSIVNFVSSGAGTSLTTTTTANTGTILGGWALVNNTDWAVSAGDGTNPGAITALPAGSYTANTWGAGNNTDVQASFGSAAGNTQSVRFNTAAATTVTLTGPANITSGGILVTGTVAALASQITGSTLTSNTGDLIITNNSTGTLTIASQIVENGGPMGLTKAGGGTATLSSTASTLNGPVNVMGGTLNLAGNFPGTSVVNIVSGATVQFGTGGTNGNFGSAQINNNGTFIVNRSDSFTLSNTLTGTGALTKSGAGVLTLVGTTTWAGQTNLNAGALALATDTALPSGNFRFNTAGATLRSADANLRTIPNFFDIATDCVFGSAGTGDLLLTGTFATGSGAKTLTINNTTTTVSGVITGGVSTNFITKAGPGTLVYTNAANTVNRPTSINAGTLQISAESNLGVNLSAFAANGLQFNGGTLRTTASFAIDDANRGVTVAAGGGTISPDASTTLTIANVIAGPGVLTKAGNGLLALTGTNTYTGSTVVQQGTLALGAAGSIASSTGLEPRSGATLDVTAQPGFALGGAQTLLGTGTVLGNVTAGTGSTVAPGGANNAVGTLNVTGNVTLSGGNLLFNLGSSNTPGGTFNDLLSITGGLNLTGVSTVQVAPTDLIGGTYRLINYTGALSGAGSLVASSTTRYVLTPDTGTAGQVNLTVSGSVGNLVWSGGLGGNVWDFNNTANWNSGAEKFFQQDNVTFDDTSVNTGVVLNIAVTPSSVKFDTAGTYTLTGTGRISGLTGLTKSGNGTVTISTVNDFTGGVTVNAGTLSLDATGTLGSGPVNIAGGTLALATVGTANTGAITVGAAGTLRFDGTGTETRNLTDNGSVVFTNAVTYSGVLTGTGGLNAQSAGTVTLGGTTANTNTGVATVTSGTLALNKPAGVNAIGGDVVVNAGTVSWSAADQVADTSSITVNGGAINSGNRADTIANLTINSTTLSTFSGLNVTGTATVTAGTQDMANSNGVFSAGTMVLSGFSNSRMGANGGPSTVNVGAGGLSMTNATLQFGQQGSATQTATLNLGGNVTLSGSNLFDVNLGNPISTINLGTATRTFNVTDGTTTVEPSIVSATASAGVTKTGNGLLILAAGTNSNGASTYTGDTTVTGGTLRVDGSLSGTNVTVTAATLEGSGTIATGGLGLTMGSGSFLAPGTSFGTGTLHVSGDLKIASAVAGPASAALLFDIATPGFSDEVVLTSGALSIGSGVLNFDDFAFISFGGITSGSTYVLFDGVNPIVGSLGPNTLGNLDGQDVQLQFADGGRDLVLAAVPEPGSALLLLGGLALAGVRRRRTRA